MDTWRHQRENLAVLQAGASRRWIARRLNAAYAGGLLSEDTFALRLDQLLRSRLIDSRSLIGDLNLRRGVRSDGLRTRLWRRLRPGAGRAPRQEPPAALLALDWSGETGELLIGRDLGCDVVLDDPTVSRRHARLVFRDAKWIVHDLHSTNGTAVNETYVGRCELRPGDRLRFGEQRLAID